MGIVKRASSLQGGSGIRRKEFKRRGKKKRGGTELCQVRRMRENPREKGLEKGTKTKIESEGNMIKKFYTK